MENGEFLIDLVKVIKALWKKAWAIVLVAAIFGGGMFVYKKSSYIPVYEAKTTLFASYTNSRDFTFSENEGSISQNSVADSRNILETCSAILGTRMTLEAVIDEAGLNMPYSKLSGMILMETVKKSELFTITVTGNNAEEAALIANTVAVVLPEKIAMVNPNANVGVIDSALVPSAPLANNILKDTLIAAFLGAFLVCCVVAVLDITAQYKEQKAQKKHS